MTVSGRGGSGRRAARNILTVAAILSAAWLAGCQAAPYMQSSEFVSQIDAEDKSIMVTATQKALEVNKVGESLNWTNPESGHLGSVMPTRTFKGKPGKNGSGQGETKKNCRDYQQTLTIQGATGIAYNTACRKADGTWVIAGSTDSAGSSPLWQLPGYPGYGSPHYDSSYYGPYYSPYYGPYYGPYYNPYYGPYFGPYFGYGYGYGY